MRRVQALCDVQMTYSRGKAEGKAPAKESRQIGILRSRTRCGIYMLLRESRFVKDAAFLAAAEAAMHHAGRRGASGARGDASACAPGR
jgi:hypothetical protein